MKRRQLALFLAITMVTAAVTGCGSTEDLKTAMSNMGSTKIDDTNTNVTSLKELLEQDIADNDTARKAWLDDVQEWTETNHQDELHATSVYEADITSEDLQNKCNGLWNKLQALKNTQDAYTSTEAHTHSFWTVYEPKEYIVEPSYSETIVTPATHKWITEEEQLIKTKKNILEPEEYETKTGFILPRETSIEHETLYVETYKAKPIKTHNKITKTIHHEAEYTWQWVNPIPKTKTFKAGSKINVGDTIFDHYEDPVWEETRIPAKTISVTYPEYGTYTQEIAEEAELKWKDDVYAKCYCGKILKYECLESHRQNFMIANMFESMPVGVWNPEKNAAYEVDRDIIKGAHNGYQSFRTLDVENSTYRDIIYWNYKKVRDTRTTSITTNPAHTDWNRLKQGKNVYRKATAADARTFDKDTTLNWGMETNGYWKKVQTRAAYDETITVCPEWTEYDTSRNLEDMLCEKSIAQYPFTETLTDTLPDQDKIGTIRKITKEEVSEIVDLPENEWYYETVQLDEPKEVVDEPERTAINFYDAVTEIRSEPKCWACSFPGCKETRTYDPANPLPPNTKTTEPEQPEEPTPETPGENPDQIQANAVIESIGAIGTVSYTTASKTKIDAARTAYDSLTSPQKVLVSNYQTLVEAESTYNRLKEESELNQKSDAEKAKWADDKIEAIGTVSYTPKSKFDIEAARNAYDKLSESAKSLCNNTDLLLNAEALYQKMQKTAKTQTEQLNEILEGAPDDNYISECLYFFNDILEFAENRTDVKDTASSTWMVLLQNTANQAIETAEQEIEGNPETECDRKLMIGMVKGFRNQLDENTWMNSKSKLLDARVLPHVYNEDLITWTSAIELYAIRNNDTELKNLAANVRTNYQDESRLDTYYEQLISNLSGTGIGTLSITSENQIIIEGDSGITIE